MKTKISKAVKVLSVASFVLSAHFAKAEEQTEVQAIEAKGTQIAAQVKEGIDTAAQAVSESPIVTTAVETTQKIGEQLKEAGISPEAAKAAIVDIEERAKEVGMSVEEYLGTRAYYKAEQLGTKATLTVAELLAKMNPEEIKSNKTLVEQGISPFQFVFIELLISQRSILKNSTKDDIITALKTSLSVYEKKSKKKNIYSLFSLSTTSLILARILEQSNTKIYETLLEQNPILIEFVEKAFVPSKDLMDQIATSSLEYLNQLEL